MTSMRAAVAWGKASGLTRIGKSIADFRDRGSANYVELIVGIDEGGATWEGLELVRRVANRGYIFHDRAARTFHTKLYVISGESSASVVVGSGNLTMGGLFTNYEAAVLLQLDLPADARVLDDVSKYIDSIKEASQSCKAIDDDLMTALRGGGFSIFSEAASNRRRAERRNATNADGVFGSVNGLTSAPPSQLALVASDNESDDSTVADLGSDSANELDEGVSESAIGPRFGGTAGRRGFYKRLSPHDASLDQSPGQIIIPKRFEDFFPNLVLQWDQIDRGGSRQLEVLFPATFIDGEYRKDLREVRLIRYEPKASHKRRNTELRFTFHDRSVFRRFAEGDYIEFRAEGDSCVIRRVPAFEARSSKFAWL